MKGNNEKKITGFKLDLLGENMKKKLFSGDSKAFTLVELLVIIFIIGLLASIVIVSVRSARTKGRDARRRVDLETMRTAMEFYKDKTGTYKLAKSDGTFASRLSYPSSSWLQGGWLSAESGGSYPAGQSATNVLIDRGIISSIIVDPGNSSRICSSSASNCYAYLYTVKDSGHYCIYAQLEKPNLGTCNPTTSTKACWDSASSQAGRDNTGVIIDYSGYSTYSGQNGYEVNYRVGNGC